MKRALAVAVAVAVIVAGGVAWRIGSGAGQQPPDVPRSRSLAGQIASATPSPQSATPSPEPSSCAQVARAFAPKTITVPGVTRRASVVTPPRDADGVPGVPPLTEAGKAVFAWDREQGIRPGDPAGNVLLNAHTWPDGSALGNRLLARLQRGDRIVLFGSGTRLCYRVTERVELPAEQKMPRYYATDGSPQLAILVCSGRRLGPGVWERRTVWFASPAP